MSLAKFTFVLGSVILLWLFLELGLPWLWKRKALLKLWWRSGQFSPPEKLEFRTWGGKIKSGRPVGMHGLHLLVICDSGREMVSVGQVWDRDTFWKTWRHFGGGNTKLYDEDGNEFDPTEN